MLRTVQEKRGHEEAVNLMSAPIGWLLILEQSPQPGEVQHALSALRRQVRCVHK
jgi:hypothetical protein